LRYYLSGAITKQPHFREYFNQYEDTLRKDGVVDIFNPAGVDWCEGVKWEICMKYDLKELMDCHVLVLLPNWRKSRGAKLEVRIAKALGIRVVSFDKLIWEVRSNAS
jgi:hypothetical protein